MMTEHGSSLNIICLESAAFTALMDRMVEQLENKFSASQDKWISDEEAM